MGTDGTGVTSRKSDYVDEPIWAQHQHPAVPSHPAESVHVGEPKPARGRHQAAPTNSRRSPNADYVPSAADPTRTARGAAHYAAGTAGTEVADIPGHSTPFDDGAPHTAPIDDGAPHTAPIDDGGPHTAPIDDGAPHTAPIDDGGPHTAPIASIPAHLAPAADPAAHASRRAGEPRGPSGPAGTAPAAGGPTGTAPPRRRKHVRTVIRGLGQTLITLGMIVLLFVVYELFVTDLITDQRQDELTQELLQNWVDDPTLGPDLPGGGLSQIPLGDGFAFIRIPGLGADYVRVVVEGTGASELEQGPGHYADSAMPGELGNFAVAGHRVGKGSPFLDLDQLRPGDAIVIETADTWFVYRILGDPATGNFGADPSGIPGQEIVSPTEVGVIFPIPGVDDATVVPTTAYLTLTTCHPKFSAQQRLILHASLEGSGLSKVDYPDGPPALTEN